MVEAGNFRADLFHRLAGHRVELPPVRARREDLGILIRALVERHAGDRAAGVSLHPLATRALLDYEWPGNVRELEKAFGAAIALAGGGELKLEHFPAALRRAPQEESAPVDERKSELLALLREHRGNVSAIARATGKARMQVQRWLKRYDLDPEPFRR
jgi:transcriptional regulator of acetoin/glycerol metabolism